MGRARFVYYAATLALTACPPAAADEPSSFGTGNAFSREL